MSPQLIQTPEHGRNTKIGGEVIVGSWDGIRGLYAGMEGGSLIVIDPENLRGIDCVPVYSFVLFPNGTFSSVSKSYNHYWVDRRHPLYPLIKKALEEIE